MLKEGHAAFCVDEEDILSESESDLVQGFFGVGTRLDGLGDVGGRYTPPEFGFKGVRVGVRVSV